MPLHIVPRVEIGKTGPFYSEQQVSKKASKEVSKEAKMQAST